MRAVVHSGIPGICIRYVNNATSPYVLLQAVIYIAVASSMVIHYGLLCCTIESNTHSLQRTALVLRPSSMLG